MIMQIGFCAGDIWQTLDRCPDRTARLSAVAAQLSHPRDLLLMSVGWLAREGHVILKPEGGDYLVSVRNQNASA